EGVPLFEILKAAGVPFGTDLRGPALASYLVVEASDGYRVVFALPELDPAFTDHIVLLADRRDGKPLEGEEGALRLVVLGEKRHARWVRKVVALRIRRAWAPRGDRCTVARCRSWDGTRSREAKAGRPIRPSVFVSDGFAP